MPDRKVLICSNVHCFEDSTRSIIHLLDGTSTLDNATSQFVNSIDDLQQTSPTQIFSFSSAWSTSSSIHRTSDDELISTLKELKLPSTTCLKSTLECHQSRRISNRSDSIDLDMDDPLQSPTLTPAIAYLEEEDLMPPTTQANASTTDNNIEQLHTNLGTAIERNITTSNLAC
jgi:hypothetical protein